MASSEDPLPSGPQSDTGTASPVNLIELQDSHRSLRALVQVMVVSMLLLNGSVFVFLLRETSATRRQVRELTQFVAAYEKNSVPVMRQFRDKLIEFARSNADFAPILSKYVHPTNYASSAQAPGLSRPAGDEPPAQKPVLPAK